MSSEFMGESCGVAQKEAYLREICRVDRRRGNRVRMKSQVCGQNVGMVGLLEDFVKSVVAVCSGDGGDPMVWWVALICSGGRAERGGGRET